MWIVYSLKSNEASDIQTASLRTRQSLSKILLLLSYILLFSGEFREYRYRYRISKNIELEAVILYNVYQDKYLTCDVDKFGQVSIITIHVSL